MLKLHSMSFKKVLLVKPGKTWSVDWGDVIPIGLEYIAGSIQNHVEKIELVDLAKDRRKIRHYLQKLRPDLVGISLTFAIEHNETMRIAGEAKKAGAAVVLGGFHATGLADELPAHPDIDFVVRGEGEQTMLELVQKGSPEGVLGISYFKDGKVMHNPDRPLINDLDSIPYPARNLRKYKYTSPFSDKKVYDAITSSRGCWGRCKFCCEPMMCKGIQRYRKPQEVVKEVKHLLSLHKEGLMINIADPNLCGNAKIFEELCDGLIKLRAESDIPFHFKTSVRTDSIGSNKALAGKMVKAGMDLVLLGIESPDSEQLKKMGKGTRKELQEKAVDNIKNSGGKVWGTFVIALPFQAESDIRNCYEYARKLKLHFANFMVFTPLPGSELYKELKPQGVIAEKNWDKFDYAHLVFRHPHLTKDDLKNFYDRLIKNPVNALVINDDYGDLIQAGPAFHRKLTFKNKKIPLFRIALRFKNILSKIASSRNGDYSSRLITPDLRKFTEERKLHEIFDSRLLLKFIGGKKIQITVNEADKPKISWIIQTTKNSIEYLDAVSGNGENADISLFLDTEEIKTRKGLLSRMLKKSMKINSGLRKKIDFVRLMIALFPEIMAYRAYTKNT